LHGFSDTHNSLLHILKLQQDLVRKLESCLKLNEAYQEQYRLTKSKLEQTPKGKQFSFNEMQIFGKFDLFCRRVIKLIDMFSTIDQFNSLSKNKLEGMERLIEQVRVAATSNITLHYTTFLLCSLHFGFVFSFSFAFLIFLLVRYGLHCIALLCTTPTLYLYRADSLRNHCAIHAESTRNPCGIDTQSMRNRHAIHADSLRDRFAIAAESTRNRCGFVAQSLLNRFGIDTQSLRN
jgi:hypothetical protein